MKATTSRESEKVKYALRLAAVLVLVLLLPGVRPSIVGARSAGKSSIDLKALLHNSWQLQYRKPFGAVPAGTHVTLELRTAHNGATSVQLYSDVAAALGTTTSTATHVQSMRRVSTGTKYDMWETVFIPTTVNIYEYEFLVKRGSAKAWYGNNEAAEGGVGLAYTGTPDQEFHLTSYEPTFHAVSWARNMVIYQIFPDRFYDGDPSNNTLGMDPVYGGEHPIVHTNWNDLPIVYPTPGYDEDFFGGDLRGIIDKLPYLKSLGVNTLYLNPIFLAPSDHKYDTANYMEIDPRFGTMQDFQDLVTAVHADGMHLILDGVFNHTSSDSVYFNQYRDFDDVGAHNSMSSPYYSWYRFTAWPTAYQEFADSLPTLQENDAVKDFIFRQPDSVAQHWLSAGADGWRLDAATYKSHQWWQEFRTAVKAKFPNDILICECDLAPIDAVSYLMGNELDGDMNYRFRDIILSFFAHGAGSSVGVAASAKGFFDNMMSMVEEYPLPALYSSMNVVDSHDTIRIYNALRESIPEVKLVAAFQATWLGAPTVYYGDEAGLGSGDGANPQDYRRPFPWSNPNTDLQAWYTRVLNIRDQNPALQDGTIAPLELDNAHRIVSFVRKDSKQTVIVVFNDGPTSRNVTLQPGKLPATKFTDQIGGKSYTLKNGKVTVSVPAVGVAILTPAG